MALEAWLEPVLFSPKAQKEALMARNEKTAKYGLVLSEKDCEMLLSGRQTALSESGRMEFGNAVLPALIDAFSDSPYLYAADYANTLNTLQALFYRSKTEAAERLRDDELLLEMRQLWDMRAHGSLSKLEEMLDGLCRAIRGGQPFCPDDNKEEAADDASE